MLPLLILEYIINSAEENILFFNFVAVFCSFKYKDAEDYKKYSSDPCELEGNRA